MAEQKSYVLTQGQMGELRALIDGMTCRNEAEAISELLSSLPPAPEWCTDMEAAPKDGTEVIVFFRQEGEDFHSVAWWSEASIDDCNEPGWTDGRVADWRYQENVRLHPIAWLPLSALPLPPQGDN